MSKLVGYRRFTSKKNGKDYCVAQVVTPYGQRDLSRNCVGSKVETIYLPEDQYDLLKPADIGKEITFDYEFSGNLAYVVHATLK